MNEVKKANISTAVNKTLERTPEEQLVIGEVKRLITQGQTSDGIIFKKVHQDKSVEEPRQVNGAIKHLMTRNKTPNNNLIKAANLWIDKQLGLKKVKKGGETGAIVQKSHGRRYV